MAHTRASLETTREASTYAEIEVDSTAVIMENALMEQDQAVLDEGDLAEEDFSPEEIKEAKSRAEAFGLTYQGPGADEQAGAEGFTPKNLNLQAAALSKVDIPYVFTVGAATVMGLLTLREKAEDASTKGYVVGALIGEYELSKKKTEAYVYDPLVSTLRLRIKIDFKGEKVTARLDHRIPFVGKWKNGKSGTIIRF